MVTKQVMVKRHDELCSVLAKILMVTKHADATMVRAGGSVLAKILMVTKRKGIMEISNTSSVLAKILMVTKRCQ